MKPIQLTKPKRLRHIFTHPTHFEITHHAMALKCRFEINSLFLQQYSFVPSL